MHNGISAEIIRRHAAGEQEGEYLSVRVDFVLLHEPAMALLLDDLARLNREIWDPDKILVTIDHFAPPASVERANIVRKVLSYVEKNRLPNRSVYGGICHQLLVEGPWVKPGGLVLGSDSHTVTAGALGCLATGMGSTDILYTLVTGRTWLRPPQAVKVDLNGHFPPGVMGKDLILDLLGRGGENGFAWQAVEFVDQAQAVCMDDRFAVCNMVVEGGAKNGLFYPDEITAEYLRNRGDNGEPSGWPGDFQPEYNAQWNLELSDLEPVLALPHSPANVVPVSDVKKERVDQVFIGSCTGGRLTDIRMAASILKGHKICFTTRLLVIPASTKIYTEAMDHGYLRTILDAGGVIMNPSCGPCGGIDKGILADGDTCLSTSNRNFKGRMGSPQANVMLASPATAAATAIAGVVTDPREFLP